MFFEGISKEQHELMCISFYAVTAIFGYVSSSLMFLYDLQSLGGVVVYAMLSTLYLTLTWKFSIRKPLNDLKEK